MSQIARARRVERVRLTCERIECDGGSMSFYLGVWNSPTAISDDQAAARYASLNDEKSVEPEFDPHVYAFYCRLTTLYPEVELVPEDKLDACPWACGIDIAGDHVIIAIRLEQSETVVSQVLALAAQDEIVCFDPQAGKVYLPPCLEAKRAPVAAVAACASNSQPSAFEINTKDETSGGEGLHPNPSSGVLSEQ